jgi:hypothetical protein
VTIACPACWLGRVEVVYGCPNDPDAKVYEQDCEKCGGSGATPCVGCHEGATLVAEGRHYCSEKCAEEDGAKVCACSGVLGRVGDSPCPDKCEASLPYYAKTPPSPEAIRLANLMATYVA